MHLKHRIKRTILGIDQVTWKARYYVRSFFGCIYRNLRYRNVYFLDTSFIIGKKDDTDQRFARFWKIGKSYTTNIVVEETVELLRRHDFVQKIKVPSAVSFEFFYEKYSSVCPVYHNFIAAMHSPAQVSSDDFLLRLILSKHLSRKRLTKLEDQYHIDIMSRISKSALSMITSTGEKKDEASRVVDEAYARNLKKRRDGFKGMNKNYPNDLRTLALVYVYAILNRKNVIFVTADSDSLILFFDWFSTIVQQITFNTKSLEVLAKYDNRGMKELFSDKKTALFFDSRWMQREIEGTLQKFFSNHTKYFAPRLTIKYWDKNRQQFFKYGVNLDKNTKELFWWSHGPLNCSTARNNIMGAFIGYMFWWPPAKHNGHFIKLLPRLKPIYKVARYYPSHIHDHTCRYRSADLASRYDQFSGFRV